MSETPLADFCPVPVHAAARPVPHTALRIGVENDPLEHDADRAAAQVVRGLPARVSPRSATAAGPVAPPAVAPALRSEGRPLDSASRAFHEARFGRDFGSVRLHTGHHAGEAAQAVGAQAFTVGHDIVFGSGHAAPNSADGRRLLAHELAHVVQQSGAAGAPLLLQRSPSFKNCKTRTKGHEDEHEAALTQAVNGAKTLTKAALDSLTQGIPIADSEFREAFKANFGEPTDDRIKAVTQVYQQIDGSLDNKNFVCDTSECEHDKGFDTCARASSGNDSIEVCPAFFRDPCAGQQPSNVLHEAAHNAGAMGDIDKPPPKRQYPPNNAEQNAYSYEHFAEDMANHRFAAKSPPLGTGPRQVQVPDDKDKKK